MSKLNGTSSRLFWTASETADSPGWTRSLVNWTHTVATACSEEGNASTVANYGSMGEAKVTRIWPVQWLIKCYSYSSQRIPCARCLFLSNRHSFSTTIIVTRLLLSLRHSLRRFDDNANACTLHSFISFLVSKSAQETGTFRNLLRKIDNNGDWQLMWKSGRGAGATHSFSVIWVIPFQLG